MIEIAVLGLVSADFDGCAGKRGHIQQHHVNDLAAAAHAQFFGGAANNFNVVNLISRDAAQLAAAFIALARHALAIDEHFTST